ncbi:MAG TPA: ATP-dependent helicase [Longilinea sp.]|nr:ATP-dependent helicase [Longilinea sp.]
MFEPRPMQAEVLRYTQGKMGVAAVPGSGKTHTLSYLAAKLIATSNLADDQEVLIVTLVNSAVNNFSQRISGFVKDMGLLPNMGYRVRTLHGLAHDIVRERPDLVGLSDRFQIIDEREASSILDGIVSIWLRSHPEFQQAYTKEDIDLDNNRRVRDDWHQLAASLGSSFIRMAKDLQATPAQVRTSLDALGRPDPLLEMGYEMYADYQRALNYRSAVDFDDLIALALRAMTLDAEYLARLQHRWPFILEDEAQDSSRLQEEILRLLSGENSNWVRVGDTNQAIYETFTTANPKYLRQFLEEPDVTRRDLANSGRSTRSIISLANYLIDWTRTQHPVEELRDSLNPPYIDPTPPGDPQPNPPDDPENVKLIKQKFTPEEEIQAVGRSLEGWLPDHTDQTVAVLVPRNTRGAEVVSELKKRNLPCVELLLSSQTTRQTAHTLAAVLGSLSDPANPAKLAAAFKNIPPAENEADKKRTQWLGTLIQRCSRVEDFLQPQPGSDWLDTFTEEALPEDGRRSLEAFRDLIDHWQRATLLPIDQLLLTLGQDLFTAPTDLALVHKFALTMEQAARDHPDWRLTEFSEELTRIAENKRKFMGFSEEDTGFDPEQYKGKVVVATVHKAKGLEWDRVYLLSVNNYDFPSNEPYDTFISEKWYVRDQLNLEAETLDKLKAALSHDVVGAFLEEGIASRQARLDYTSERLRLLYVGITRARKQLIITWNTGRRGDCQPALPFLALQTFWENNHAAAA